MSTITSDDPKLKAARVPTKHAPKTQEAEAAEPKPPLTRRQRHVQSLKVANG